jgi:hypothetical protein
VPEERLGVVVLTNQEETGAFEAVRYRVFDEYLGAPAPPLDWIAAFRKRAEDARKKAEEAVAKAPAARDAASRPSLALAGYAGRYRDSWYGDVTIAEEAGRLVLTMTRTPGMVADLEHWQHDTFVARWREVYMSDEAPADAYVKLRPRARRLGRARDDGAGVTGDRLQLRLPGPVPHVGPGGGQGREGAVTS